MDDAEYRHRMQRKKAAMDRRIAAASADKGLLLALTGTGMGKSSSAFGMAARALGHGLQCVVARLGDGAAGELAYLRHAGSASVRDTQSEPVVTTDWLAAVLADPTVDVVILDAVDRAIETGHLEPSELGEWLARRPEQQHVVIEGGDMPAELLDMADTITEMRDAKQVLDAVAATGGETVGASAAAWCQADHLDAPTGRGRLLVHTGNGKGKSSAAFGKALRALGHGRSVGVLQFIKGNFNTGERRLFDGHAGVRYRVMGQGFTWETQDRSRDQRNADAAWSEAEAMLTDAELDLVILDELNIAIKKELVDLDRVLAALRTRPAHQDVIVTGRNARPGLMNAADAVTQVHKQRHAFDAGCRAQNGIDL